MKKLFSAHFGEALNSPIKFSMKDFQESFHQVFSFLSNLKKLFLEKKLTLSLFNFFSRLEVWIGKKGQQ